MIASVFSPDVQRCQGSDNSEGDGQIASGDMAVGDDGGIEAQECGREDRGATARQPTCPQRSDDDEAKREGHMGQTAEEDQAS